ncbi:MAG: helix-turn-helix domain-containing protein [bacterium]
MNTLENFLNQLNLSSEEVEIYKAIYKNKICTVLEIARFTGIKRTTVYRLLEELTNIGIIEEITDEFRKLYKVSPAESMEKLVIDQESKTQVLRNIFPEVSVLINSGITDPETKVIVYQGTSRVKQMVWHTLKAKGEVLGYTYRKLQELVGEDYEIKWKNEFMNKKLGLREIISDEYLESVKNEKVAQEFDYELFQTRYIPSNILSIPHQMDIYNNVVSYYSWRNNDIFGVEIYNEKFTLMQKQLFEIVWGIAVKA